MLDNQDPDEEEKSMQEQVWKLINQIATNKKIYDGLLVKNERSSADFWKNAFDDENKFKKMYK